MDYSVLGNNQNSDVHKKALDYEFFVNSIEYYRSQKEVNTESIKQMSTGDLRGIDGCYVLINNQFFYLPPMEEDTDFFQTWKDSFKNAIEKVRLIEAEFVFLQSKSSKTELDKFKGFCDAIYDVFSKEKTDLSQNLQVKTIKFVFQEIAKKEHEFNLSIKLCAIQKDSRTLSRLVATPEWSSAILKQKKDLKSTIFKQVNIDIKSGQDYQEELDAILSPNQRVFPIENLKSRFIDITNEEATCYIGFLNLKEVKELLTNEMGQLDDIFFDNIRYFEGMGTSDSINSKIYRSLDENKKIFHLLHNGITITAHSKHFNPENGNLEIKAFSIVNGCQTSNIIWKWIEHENKTDEVIEKINIPVKIIISSNTDLRAKVTETANSQNEVNTIQLVAISDEAKTLQRLFDNEIRSGEKLYYERLTNQYPDVSKSLKLMTTDIFRAFYSGFGRSPHKLTVGYGVFEKEMLKKQDFLIPNSNGSSKYDINCYFISSVLFNYLERFLRSKFPSLISLRHHFLLLLIITIDEKIISDFDMYKSKLPKSFSDSALSLVKSKENFERTVTQICNIAIDNFDFFIVKSADKPRVILKSYYTEEGTKKMIEIFKSRYFS